MYKIKMFNTRDEEVEIAKKWAKENNVIVDITTESLTMENVKDLKDFDGVTASPVGPLEMGIYKKLNDLNIRQIAQRSAGVDMYDLEEAKKNNIYITNVPSYSPESIAEFTLSQTLNLIRKIRFINKRVENHNFSWHGEIRGKTLSNMKVAILGTGRIGYMYAKLLKGFGTEIIGYDLYPNDKAREILTYVDKIEDAIKDADIISLHMPATNENYHIFDQALLNKCKKGAYILNMARGNLIDTKALLDAIGKGQISGAALDTMENEDPYVPKDLKEKPIEDEIFKKVIENKKILYTPHVAFYTDEAVEALALGGLNATLDILKNKDTKNIVNR